LIGGDLPDLILTARSGRAALKNRMAALNIPYVESEFEQYYEQFLRLADTKPVVTGKDLTAIFETSKNKSLKPAYGILDRGIADYQFNLKSMRDRT